MMPRVTERLTKLMRNFVYGKPTEEIRRHCCSLLVVQLFQTLLNEACAFFERKAVYGGLVPHEQLRLNFFDLHTGVIPTAFQMTPMVDRTCVGVSQQQCTERTSLLDVPQHGRMHFEEKALHQILGL